MDQPSWKKGQHQTPETRPQLQTSRKKEIVDALGNNGNTSMLEQVKQPDPWRKMMMICMCVCVHEFVLFEIHF